MTTTYEYTPAGERSEIDYEDPATHDVSYRYDPDGRQTAMVDATGQSTFSYDSLGRLTSVTAPTRRPSATAMTSPTARPPSPTPGPARSPAPTPPPTACCRTPPAMSTTAVGGYPEVQATLMKALLDDEDSAFERGELIFGAIDDGYRSPAEASGAR
ncbi:MAG: hypothetical protein QOE31_1677 [Solirubrobacteraceae bacterium]|nr:hypothetical protein [Solirubrobacteraceae bacterium]